MHDPTHVGGSFAPEITDQHLAEWPALIAAASPQIRDAIEKLHNLVEQHRTHAPSAAKGTPHPSGRGLIVPLDPATVAKLDPHLPWESELDGYGTLFESLDPISDKPTRDMAFHLLWYAKELALDREPITIEKLRG